MNNDISPMGAGDGHSRVGNEGNAMTGESSAAVPGRREDGTPPASCEQVPAIPVREWENRLLRLPGTAAAADGPNMVRKIQDADGIQLSQDLNSTDTVLRDTAEQRILTDSIVTALTYKKLLEARMAALVGAPDEKDPHLAEFNRLAGMRDRFEKQIHSALRTRRALGSPGPVNISMNGSGPQQVNVGNASGEKSTE